jgi:hypothetical protein
MQIGVEADVAQQQVVLRQLELGVEDGKDRVASESGQRRSAPTDQQVANLGEGLRDPSRLATLLGDRRGHARPVIEAVFPVVETELTHRAVVDDTAVGEDVVPVPVEPAKDVLRFEGRGGPAEDAGRLLCEATVAPLAVAQRGTDAVADLPVDVVIHRGAQRLQIPLSQVHEEVRGPDQVVSGSDVDGVPVVEQDHGQHALGGNPVTVQGLAHQGRRQAFLERSGAASVTGDSTARLEESLLLGGCRTESGHAGAAARYVPGDASRREAAVPDAAPVARAVSSAIRMLQLEVSRGHVAVGQQVAFREARVVLQVVLVDDHQAERPQDRTAERRVEPLRMVFCEQPHLLGQGEVEVDDLAAVQPAGRVVDVTARHGPLERVTTVDSQELRVAVVVSGHGFAGGRSARFTH